MPWRTYDADDFFDRGGYWYHKIHIYLYPMYYINYTLTTMGAMEFRYDEREIMRVPGGLPLALQVRRQYELSGNTALCKAIANPFEQGSVARDDWRGAMS